MYTQQDIRQLVNKCKSNLDLNKDKLKSFNDGDIRDIKLEVLR